MAALDGLVSARGRTRREPPSRPPRSGRAAMDWDDVRVFLAIARKGSMRAAGRALGLSQPTIARRLAAFEATFGGATLFDRLPEGLRLNAAGLKLVPAAESVEEAALTLERRRAAASPGLGGTVRVSTGECAAGFLARFLSEPTRALPAGITLELIEFATDEEPFATRSRHGVAPRAAAKWRLLYLQGGHLRLFGLPAPWRRGCRLGHLYRRTSALCARALGAAAGRRDRKADCAACVIHADARGSDPRRHRPRHPSVLRRRRPSPARAADAADCRTCRWILDHRSPRPAPRALRARGHRLDESAFCRAAGRACRPAWGRERPCAEPQAI